MPLVQELLRRQMRSKITRYPLQDPYALDHLLKVNNSPARTQLFLSESSYGPLTLRFLKFLSISMGMSRAKPQNVQLRDMPCPPKQSRQHLQHSESRVRFWGSGNNSSSQIDIAREKLPKMDEKGQLAR